MKKLMLSMAALAFCATALAAGAASGLRADDPSSSPQGSWSYAKYHQILGRLKLTDEQIKKIDAIYAEYNKKFQELYKDMRGKKMTREERTTAYKKINEKRRELEAERDKKILEVLTAEQKKLYALAVKIIAEFKVKIAEVSAGYKDARKIKDMAKRRDFYKQLSAKRGQVVTEQNKQLDAKVGKLPAMPKTHYGRGDNNPNGQWQGTK